ncbi:NYN domain-containing protein [Trametes punicea]|nr:NYN domain-containing protein [Trametes punicea]
MTVKDLYDEPVAIFWDYENCTPPCNVPGYDVVNNIRQVAHEYGSVKLFKAYLELSEQSSSKSIGLRSELQSCGVSLTDCPHNGRKDVADKMMIVDMLTYAIDNPAPATIVLISGDRDFVYAVSVLRLRRYRVVVVAPYTAHASLKSQASMVLDWEADIMRKTTTRSHGAAEAYQAHADDAQHRSPRRPPLTVGGVLPQCPPKSNRRASFRTPASAPVVDPDESVLLIPGMSFQGRHLRATSEVTANGSVRPEVPSSTDRSASDHGVVCSPAMAPLLRDRKEDALVNREPIPDIIDIMQDIQEERSWSSRPVSRLEVPAVGARTGSIQMLPVSKPTPLREVGWHARFRLTRV